MGERLRRAASVRRGEGHRSRPRIGADDPDAYRRSAETARDRDRSSRAARRVAHPKPWRRDRPRWRRPDHGHGARRRHARHRGPGARRRLPVGQRPGRPDPDSAGARRARCANRSRAGRRRGRRAPGNGREAGRARATTGPGRVGQPAGGRGGAGGSGRGRRGAEGARGTVSPWPRKGVSASGAIRSMHRTRRCCGRCMPTPGQTVSAGAPLFDLVTTRFGLAAGAAFRRGCRVDRPAGRRSRSSRSARQRRLPASPRGRSPLRRPPIRRPPASTCSTALPMPTARLRPGQRVSVRVPLRATEAALVGPARRPSYSTPSAAPGSTRPARAACSCAGAWRSPTSVGDSAVLDQGPAVGHPGRDRGRRGALRHRVRCRQVGGARQA